MLISSRSSPARALKSAGLTLPVQDPEHFGMLVGSGIGGMEAFEEQHKILLAKTIIAWRSSSP
jgi:3-oxoacyl-(acyl-carrier-protein) synthase